jgi:Zn-dependent protease
MIFAIFAIIVLVFSAIIHEYMHGFIANEEGDATAKDLGRLTLNPLAHLDPWGSFGLPIFLYIISGGAFVFGYAKPVPIDPRRFRDPKWSQFKVALAGPLSNLAVALVFGLILRFLPVISTSFTELLQIIVQINLILFIFNMIPIPPLDGSRVIFPFLPFSWQKIMMKLEPYGIFIALFFVIFFFSIVSVAVDFLFKLIAG